MNKLGPLFPEAACRWWLLCENTATQTLSHPVLGDVPICDRCLQKCKDLGMEIEDADTD